MLCYNGSDVSENNDVNKSVRSFDMNNIAFLDIHDVDYR